MRALQFAHWRHGAPIVLPWLAVAAIGGAGACAANKPTPTPTTSPDTGAPTDAAGTGEVKDASGSDAGPSDGVGGDGSGAATDAVDAGADAPADAAGEVGGDATIPDTFDAKPEAADGAADVPDAGPEVADTGPEVADTGPEVTDTGKDGADGGATDAAAADVAGSDVAAACKDGALKRCWVECPQVYAPECISGKIPILILGTQACAGGQWDPCATMAKCSDYATGPCQNGSKAPQTYLCTDGTSKTGAHICTKPLGAKCNLSYYINWPLWDCPLLCAGPDDTCNSAGAKRPCEVACGAVGGPIKAGEQTCQSVCDGMYWSACQTGDACL